jgi:protein phosphatase PTC4
MEDAHNTIINELELVAMFSVFDGHGGKLVSEYLSNHLPKSIFKSLNHYHRHHSPLAPPPLPNVTEAGDNCNTNTTSKPAQNESTSNSNSNVSGCSKSHLQSYLDIIKDTFFKIDSDLSNIDGLNNCGSTAIVATVIEHRYIIVANTGDSRCILSLDGIAKTLSFDHKPILMNERIRIENSNGYVLNSRINEILALSRAFGDFKFKTPVLDSTSNKYIIQNKSFFKNGLIEIPPELFQVTVEPEFLVYDMENQTTPEFIVLACDGIWDCYKNSRLVTIIRNKLGLGWKLSKIIEFILHDCLSLANNYTGVGFDNMTIIIVAVHVNNNIEEWYEQMVTKIQKEKGLVG